MIAKRVRSAGLGEEDGDSLMRNQHHDAYDFDEEDDEVSVEFGNGSINNPHKQDKSSLKAERSLCVLRECQVM